MTRNVWIFLAIYLLIVFYSCSQKSIIDSENPPKEVIRMFMKEEYDSLQILGIKYKNIKYLNSLTSISYLYMNNISQYELVNQDLIKEITIDSSKLGKAKLYKYKLNARSNMSSYDAFSLYLYCKKKYSVLLDLNSLLLSYAHNKNNNNVLAELYLNDKEGFVDIDQNVYIDSLLNVYPYWLDLYVIKMDKLRLSSYNTDVVNSYKGTKHEIIDLISFLESKSYYKKKMISEGANDTILHIIRDPNYLTDDQLEKFLTKLNKGNYFLRGKFLAGH